MSEAFHMIRLACDAARLMELGRMLRLPLSQLDLDYIVHCALGELFQQQAPGCYWIEPQREGRTVRVLAYSEVPLEALHELAKGYASPTVYAIVEWEKSAGKPMPEVFPEGMSLGFEVRVTPTMRLAKPLAPNPPHHRGIGKGAELDAYQVARERGDESATREGVYEGWLRRRLEPSCAVQRCAMERFSLAQTLRRGGARSGSSGKRASKRVTLPDVIFRGALEVRQGEEFASLLRRGVGRHRGFGYGMMRVRRVQASG